MSTVIESGLAPAFSPLAAVISIVTFPPLTLADVTFVPVFTPMPRFLNAFASSADTASSSFGTRRGSNSITVTSAPNRLKIDANSTPTAPLPMIAIDAGTAGRWIAWSLVMMCVLSISMPGTLRGDEPVATMISFAVSVAVVSPVTSIVPWPARRALPLIQSILFFLNRNSMPLVRPVTILFLRACTWPMSIVGVTFWPNEMPHSDASCATFSAWAFSRSAFVGMHPHTRQVPPSWGARSTTAVLRPS
jgi:hypothetical protein